MSFHKYNDEICDKECDSKARVMVCLIPKEQCRRYRIIKKKIKKETT